MMDVIEQAIIAHLKAASDGGLLGYRYGALDSYPVDWDAYLKEKQAGMKAPAAWVTFAGWRPKDGDDAGSFSVTATFGLIVMAENVRQGETPSRHGGPDPSKEPGSYRLAMDAAALLHGRDFGLPIDSISIGALRFVQRLPAWGERKVSMLALELITGFSQQALPGGPGSEELLDDFATFHANWDIPPFGNVDADEDEPGVQIPADATADATDHVELEIEEP